MNLAFYIGVERTLKAFIVSLTMDFTRFQADIRMLSSIAERWETREKYKNKYVIARRRETYV